MDKNEQEILSIIRTLLALERNFLAEERTCLAEFRTGLAFIVLGPVVGTILAYILSSLALEEAPLYDLINVICISTLTGLGIWITLRSRSQLKEIRKKKNALKIRQSEITKSSKVINDLLGDCICIDGLKVNES